jgi:glycosyltransferase involved in cell wall biosynthesis
MPYRLAILNSHPIQYFAPLYRRLAQDPDIDLTVYFCSSQGAEEYQDTDFGVSVKWDVPLLEGYKSTFLSNLRRGKSVGGFFSLINSGIIRELRRGKYDALWVHGHGYATYVLAILVSKVLGIPVLMRCETHLLLHRSPFKRALRRTLMRLLYTRLCAACLPIGTRNEEFYRFHGVDQRHLFLVPYAVDNAFFAGAASRFREQREELRFQCGLPPDKPALLFASKLMPRKRPMDLLQAYEGMRNSNVDACLVFVGAGELEEDLRRYVSEHCILDVHFFGFRNQSELPKFFALADVFILPSENEPWGLVINEVMAASLPVVAADEIGAVADLVKNGDNGFVYPVGDIRSLTNHLRSLADDMDLRVVMGRRSAERMAGWDFERCVAGVREALAFVEQERRGNTAATITKESRSVHSLDDIS